MSIYIFVCVVFVCVCICIYMYIYTQTQTHKYMNVPKSYLEKPYSNKKFFSTSGNSAGNLLP